MKKRVLCAGTFDLFHKGHEYFLKKAAQLGDELHVIVARDETVERIKNISPEESQQERQKKIASLPFVFHSYIGEQDMRSLPRKIQPHIIALGYDQHLPELFTTEFPNVEQVRITAYLPDRYKSSFFRKGQKNLNSQ